MTYELQLFTFAVQFISDSIVQSHKDARSLCMGDDDSAILIYTNVCVRTDRQYESVFTFLY